MKELCLHCIDVEYTGLSASNTGAVSTSALILFLFWCIISLLINWLADLSKVSSWKLWNKLRLTTCDCKPFYLFITLV